jgi:hypothetical protein
MAEPDVTLTDFGLVLECAVCAVLLGLTPTARPDWRRAAVCFFVFLGISAAAGGTVHGFYPDDNSTGSRSLWLVTLLALGLAALSAWLLAAGVVSKGRTARRLRLAGFGQAVLYGLVVLFFVREFWTAMVVNLPASLLLLAGFWLAFRQDRHLVLVLGATGLVLTFVAAVIQVARLGIHPLYFNHNACYHAVQAVALALLFVGVRHLVQAPEAS